MASIIDEEYKNLDQIVSGLLRHLAFLQYYPPDSVSLRGILIFSSMFFMALQPVIGIYENFQTWNFQFRVASIDSLIYSVCVLVISIDIFLLTERFRTNVNLTKSRYKFEIIDLNNTDIPNEKVDLVKSITSGSYKSARAYIFVISFFHLSFIVISLSDFFYYLLRIESAEKPTPRPLSLHSSFTFPAYVPKFVEKFVQTSVEIFFIYYTLVVVCNVHVFQSLSISNIIGDMKLFSLNLEEVDEYFEKVLTSESYKNATDLVRKQMENQLRSATRSLVKHHQNIFRKVQQLNYGSIFRIFYTNCYICFQIVFGITIFLKGEFIYKIKYGLILLMITIFEYIYNENGQLLQDEGEQMRISLYGFRWVGKPKWFTKPFQILMIRSNKLPKVGVLNLFTINRNNVTEVIRGTYSYFNLLNEFSS